MLSEGTVDGIFGNLRVAAGWFAEEHDPFMHMMACRGTML